MQISRLRVGNEDVLVSSMIERCPKSMMLRELVKNALEAASCAVGGDRRVEIMPQMVDGARKLRIRITGPGKDADELYRMCDIASSIGKQNGFDHDFGIGAKGASLPSNPHSIRYRSCKDGRVDQVVMGKRDDAYGRLHQTGRNGEIADVLEVNGRAAADGRGRDIEWTGEVLLGSRAEQDTVADSYDGSPAMAPGWNAEALYHRCYRLPGISVMLRDGCNTVGGDQPFRPIGARTGDFAGHEAVPIERGITLHYLYDAPDPDGAGCLLGALRPARSSAALVYRDEIYDFRPDWAWLHEAPVYGIPFGARSLSVYVQVPDDFALFPDGYRQFLRHDNDLQHQIHVREFAHLALRHRPAWLLDLLRQFAPDSRHIDHLKGAMAGLFRALGVGRRWRPPADGLCQNFGLKRRHILFEVLGGILGWGLLQMRLFTVECKFG
jgi:hypothetical protein